MDPSKYSLPEFLVGRCTWQDYRDWLNTKTVSHQRRDKKRGNAGASREAYKIAIHEAVIESQGVDAYTGQPLDWERINTYDNEQSKIHGRAYKREFGDLPTVDHVGDGLGPPDFKICAWRTNDAKNDLSHTEFVQLCRAVPDHHARTLNIPGTTPA